MARKENVCCTENTSEIQMTSGTQIETLKTWVGVYVGDGGLQSRLRHEGHGHLHVGSREGAHKCRSPQLKPG